MADRIRLPFFLKIDFIGLENRPFLILGVKIPLSVKTEGDTCCLVFLLRKEEIYRILTVSPCFAVDIKGCDFIHSVWAEIGGCMECDITYKALL